jgi:hypothetical protein
MRTYRFDEKRAGRNLEWGIKTPLLNQAFAVLIEEIVHAGSYLQRLQLLCRQVLSRYPSYGTVILELLINSPTAPIEKLLSW